MTESITKRQETLSRSNTVYCRSAKIQRLWNSVTWTKPRAACSHLEYGRREGGSGTRNPTRARARQVRVRNTRRTSTSHRENFPGKHTGPLLFRRQPRGTRRSFARHFSFNPIGSPGTLWGLGTICPRARVLQRTGKSPASFNLWN